jgi:hypothetical protein
MATITLLVDNTVPTANDFMDNYEAINDEVRPTTTGGTGLSSYTAGDFLYASATNVLAKLAVGTRGQALGVTGSGIPGWAIAAAPGYVSRLAGAFTNGTTVTYTADGLALFNASGHQVHLASVSVAPAITTSGANGLDTGVEANSTWYFVWVIYNGSSVAGLLSLSDTLAGLTLPGGYTFGRLVGVVYNEASGDFRDFRQRGNRWYWAGDNTNGYDLVFSDQTGQTSFGILGIAATIPPSRVTRVRGIMGGSVAGATTGMAVSPNSSGEYAAIALGDSAGTTELMGWAGAWPFDIHWISGQSIYWRTSGTGAIYRLSISGFDMDIS